MKRVHCTLSVCWYNCTLYFVCLHIVHCKYIVYCTHMIIRPSLVGQSLASSLIEYIIYILLKLKTFLYLHSAAKTAASNLLSIDPQLKKLSVFEDRSRFSTHCTWQTFPCKDLFAIAMFAILGMILVTWEVSLGLGIVAGYMSLCLFICI